MFNGERDTRTKISTLEGNTQWLDGGSMFGNAPRTLWEKWSTVDEKGRVLFPNARYVVGAAAWERAEHPHARDRASFVPGLTEKLAASGRLVVVSGDRVPGFLEDRLRFRISNGHTPGQMHTVFRGDRD